MEKGKVGVIGGGAAGFCYFKEHHPEVTVLFEKTTKVLSKVKISGEGDAMSPITAMR